MTNRPTDGYNIDAIDTLDDDGTYVEPDVRNSLKKYFKAMSLTKKKVKVSELRKAIRAAISENNIGHVPLKCPDCGSSNVGLWSIEGNVKNPDWAECKKCGASGRISAYTVIEASSTMGRMNFVNTSDNEETTEDETLEEFTDWAQTFQDNYSNKRYEILARQVFDSWPHQGQDTDWSKVIDNFLKNRIKNLHSELDRDKLFEKVLSLAEDNYDGNVPPTASVTHPQYGPGSK